jgi:riboflavin kinase / FMN adenylyltransferase
MIPAPMRTLHGLSALSDVSPGGVVSIGNFDGVHRGHRAILAEVRRRAGSGDAVVVTFEPHPLTALRPESAPPRLTPALLKLEQFASAGVDTLIVLPPTPEVLQLSAEMFWAKIRDGLKPAAVVEGVDFSFGRGRDGSIERLRGWCDEAKIELAVIDPVTARLADRTIVPISSTLVRWLLLHGRAEDAATCLGRAYELRGTVVQGFQRGRTIGVPTANLDVGEQLVPGDGVYAGRCVVGERIYPAAISIGRLPTFDEAAFQIEAHLIGYTGDLYGRTLGVSVGRWLREQIKYPSIDALKAQLDRDLATASEVLYA